MTLYEMTENARYLYELLEADEIDEQVVADTMEGMGVEEKLENYCKIIRQFEADAVAYKNEQDRLADKKKKCENAIERLKGAMMLYLKTVNKTEQDCGLFKVKIGSSKAANIIDENLIPKEYRIPQADKIDKASIRKALIGGETVAGAELLINENVQVR